MRKAMMWVKLFFYLIPMWISAKRYQNKSFEETFAKLKHWAKLAVKASGAKVEVEGLDNLTERTCYYVSNHEGSLDPFIFIEYIPYPTNLISKVENLHVPIIGAWMKALKIITLDRKDIRSSLQMIKETAAQLESGRNVIVYPEGTRSKGLKTGEFKAGSLKPALMAKVPIVPVTMINTYLIDTGGKAEYRTKMIFSKPIEYAEFSEMDTIELTALVESIIKKNIEEGVKTL